MKTSDELTISNLSYTNKDFVSVFNEILSFFPQLTNRYDPINSNESDPGVVFLKELAFVLDKLNYNVDKNILECFLTSATQEIAVRRLTEMLGYNMQYYRSAETSISFMYTGNVDSTNPITIPQYSRVSNEDGDIVYTLLEPVTISEKNKTFTGTAIEGSLNTFKVGDSDIIKLKDLDDNLRLYFPVSNVAQNGVIIYNKNEESTGKWTLVDNLNSQEVCYRCYKISYDSVKGLPYIEFPSDIATLIGDGLSIKYITSLGSNGNVKAGLLKVLVSEIEEIDSSLLIVNNLSSTVTGYDPETIIEAYNSFKKKVGTFDTLVTCRDYANAIYSLENNSAPIVSNVQVADRRNDINYSNYLITFNEYGQQKTNNLKSSGENVDITPYDLCLYPLRPINVSYTIETYINSFLPLSDTELVPLTSEEGYLKDLKTLSHTYKELDVDDIYVIKNYYTLDATISTTKKVDSVESQEIINNVKNALYKNFNARQVEYGSELNYDDLLETMMNADTRIKNVALPEPTLSTKIMHKDGKEFDIEGSLDVSTGKTDYLNVLAKNILLGRVALFDYDTNFKYEYGQSKVDGYEPVVPYLVSISTHFNLNKDKVLNDTYQLKENEVLQLFATNYTTDYTFPVNVNYSWTGNNVSANTEHKILPDESLKLEWTDSNEVHQMITYKHDSTIYSYSADGEHWIPKSSEAVSQNIIKPSFELKTTTAEGATKIIDNVAYHTLSTNETIEHRVAIKTSLTSINTPCYWIRNNAYNTLFTANDKKGEVYEVILDEGEYFMYSNDAKTELSILGSGTKLTLYPKTGGVFREDDWSITEDLIDIDAINTNGLAAFGAYSWRPKNFAPSPTAQNDKLDIEELQILTLTEGDTLHVEGGSLSDDITNTYQEIVDGEIQYTIDGETQALPKLDSNNWLIRSRLDLNVGPELKQQLQSIEGEKTQSITLTYANDRDATKGVIQEPITFEGDVNGIRHFMLNTTMQRAGGKDIDLRVMYPSLNNDVYYDVSAFLFNYKAPEYQYVVNLGDEDVSSSTLQLENNIFNIPVSNLVVKEGEEFKDKQLVLPVISKTNDGSKYPTQLVMIYIVQEAVIDNAEYKASVDDGVVGIYNSVSGPTGTSVDLSTGLNIIEYRGDVKNLTIDMSSDRYGIRDKTTGEWYKENLTYSELVNEWNHIEDKDKYICAIYKGASRILMSPMSVVDGINPTLGINSEDEEELLESIRRLAADVNDESKNLFFYNCSIDNATKIDVINLSNPLALYDVNNVANRITIPEIDFTNSRIDIASSSLKR